MKIRKLLPHLTINQQEFGGDLSIADPNDLLKPVDGFWNIKMEQLDLFCNVDQERAWKSSGSNKSETQFLTQFYGNFPKKF